MSESHQYILGTDDQVIHLDSLQDNRDVSLSMVQQAKRSLLIFTQDFDALVFDRPAFIDAVKDVAIRDQHSFVKIVVKDSSKAVLHGHRIVELARRLPTHLQIRKASNEFREYSSTYLIADETGYLRRPHADRYEGVAQFNARDDCKHLMGFFENAWEKAEPDPELRRLHI